MALAVVLVPRTSVGEVWTLDTDAETSTDRSGSDPPLAAGGDGPVTYPGFGYGEAVTSPTKDKPQSKLWYQDDAWWGLLVTPAAKQVHVFELQDNHAWRDTGVVVDERQLSTADALWDGERLHIATRTSSSEIRYLRLSYLPEARTYEVESGFPVVLSPSGSSSVTLAKDSTGMLWATFIQDGQVLVTHSEEPAGRRWVEPYTPLGDAGRVTDDDVSSIDSVNGLIGLMWSNQRTGAFSFITHRDGAPGRQWSAIETPVQGEAMADGHVMVVAGSDGRLYAAVKTSQDDLEASSGSAPLILVLERAPEGSWVTHVAGTVSDRMTRPELVLEEERRLLHLFYATPSGGGLIHGKTSSLDGMRWAPGLGTPVMATPGGTLNNVTSTKQSVDAKSGLVLLASDAVAHRYAHTEIRRSPDGVPPTPPVLLGAPGDGIDGLFVSGGAVTPRQIGSTADRLGWDAMVLHRPEAGFSRSRPDAEGTLVAAVRQLEVLGQTEVVVVQGGEIDAGGSAAELEVAVFHLIDYLRAHIPPSTGIVLAGPVPPTRTVPAALAAVNETLRAAARQRRVHYLDLVGRGLTQADGDLAAELTQALDELPVGRRTPG